MRKKFIKVLFGLTLGFVAVGMTAPVFAESESAVEESTTNEVVETTTTEENENTVIEEEKSAFDKLIDKLSKTEIKAYLTLLGSKLLADTTILLALALYIIRKRAKELQSSEAYQNALAKMNKEHQEEITRIMNEFTSKIDDLSKTVAKTIQSQNTDARKEAQKTIDDVLQAISDTKTSLD